MNRFNPFIALVLRVFSFDQISGYRRILVFKDRDSDTGLYSRNGVLDFYSAANIASATVAANTIVDVLLTRSAASAMTSSINAAPAFAVADIARRRPRAGAGDDRAARGPAGGAWCAPPRCLIAGTRSVTY